MLTAHSQQLDREIAAYCQRPLRWGGILVQALLFARPGWSPISARVWAQRHGFKPIKTHVTTRYVRLRLHVPVRGAEKRTVVFGDGIKAIVEAAA